MTISPDVATTPQSFGVRLRAMASGPISFAYLIILPAIVLRLTYSIVPLVQTVWMSFTNRSITNPGQFIGLANYEFLIRDERLIGSLAFTLIYTFVSVALEVVLGLMLALLLMQNLRGRWLSNFIMLLPWVMAPLLAATVWKIMFYEDGGILNAILRDLGMIESPIRWLSDANTARVSVIVVTVWKNVSWCALIFMAGLAALPRELIEAAEVDGANILQRFWFVTLPMLMPTVYLIVMLRGMAEVQTFEQINGLTRGGPGTATETLAVYAYARFFQELRYGYGSAINLLLLLCSVTIGGFFAWRLYRANRSGL